MKKVIINLSLIGIGIIGTITIQTYFPCDESATTTTSDSTAVDSVKVISEIKVISQDTVQADTTKK